jgi:hypothetical protein
MSIQSKGVPIEGSGIKTKTNLHKLPENAEGRENRYVANHETIGSTPVTNKAIADAIAQPRYTDDA